MTVLRVLDLLKISSPKFIEPVIRLNGWNLKIFKGLSSFCCAFAAITDKIKKASSVFFILLLFLQ
jgi:hypothetical protein